MYCDEPIIAVYYARWDIYMDEWLVSGSECFFDQYHEIAYHTTDGWMYLFETENYMITIDVSGVNKEYKTKEVFSIPDYEILPLLVEENGEPVWVYPEVTLFIGERLCSVEEKEGFWLLTFDDFDMKVISYELGTLENWLNRRGSDSYVPVLGCDRHIKKNCTCGGRGEILMDFVDDYLVRCKECKKSTWAYMNLIDAIEEWNAGELHCDLSDIAIG